ncbi:EPOP protein, partial [Hippolais icterina]|nr:EPOP protein [Hippolais icterina]
SSSSSSSPPPSPSSAPPLKERGHAGGKDSHKAASNKKSSGGASAGPPPCPEPPPELRGSPGPTEPRPEHFDRLIRQSKLWCYAKGFNLDGKSLRRAEASPEPWRGAELRFQPRGAAAAQSPGGSSKRRRLSGRASERQRGSPKAAPKTPGRNRKKGKAPGKPNPGRNSFSLMGNFPCTPSLVVGADGDLCPASSLGGKNSRALAKTHPLWRWHLGGSAVPAPPSIKFRGC